MSGAGAAIRISDSTALVTKKIKEVIKEQPPARILSATVKKASIEYPVQMFLTRGRGKRFSL